MRDTIQQLRQIITSYYSLLVQCSQAGFDAKSFPGKWSKKEQLGHLVDSAQNNIRRFIEAQYQSAPPVIVYNQDEWVSLCNYHQYDTTELLELWRLLNLQIVHILENIPEERYGNICIRREAHTIEWLAADYNKHLLYHLHRILELEPVPYP